VIAVSDASGAEGQSGWALQAFDVSLSGLSAATVSVSFATTPGSASAGSDFQPVAGSLSWPPGTNAAKVVWVPVAGDRVAEGDETYTLDLSAWTTTGPGCR
jgi:chitinase